MNQRSKRLYRDVEHQKIAGVCAGIRETQHRRGVPQQLADLLLVGVKHRCAEAPLQIALESQVEQTVHRVLAAFGGDLADGAFFELRVLREPRDGDLRNATDHAAAPRGGSIIV